MAHSAIGICDGHLCFALLICLCWQKLLSYGLVYAVDNIRNIFPFLQDLVGCGGQLFVLALFVGVCSKPFLFFCFFGVLFCDL